MSILERVESKIERVPEAGCWIWMASCDADGYGRIRVAGRTAYAHRVYYELVFGVVLMGFELDHLCRVRCCVNPYHLEQVTHKENMKRGETFIAKQLSKIHCLRGHLLEGTNIYHDPLGRKRVCKLCKKVTYANRRWKSLMEGCQ